MNKSERVLINSLEITLPPIRFNILVTPIIFEILISVLEEHRSSVPMLNLHQSHVVETVKKSAHVFDSHEPVHAPNSDRDLSPSSKSIFLGQTWRQTEPTNDHSSDVHLTSGLRNSVKLYNVETKQPHNLLHV